MATLPTTNLILRLEADDLVLSDGEAIATWPDSSGNGWDATQSNEAVRPIFKENIVNALPAVQFNANEFFLFGNLFGGVTEGEVFIVLQVADDPPLNAQGGIWRFGSSGSSDHYPWTDSNVYMGWGSSARKSVGNPSQDMTVWHYMNISTTANLWVMRQNGTQMFSTTSNTVAFTTTPALGRSTTTSHLFEGYIAAVFMYSSVLSTTDRDSVNAYIDEKWFTASEPEPEPPPSKKYSAGSFVFSAGPKSLPYRDRGAVGRRRRRRNNTFYYL